MIVFYCMLVKQNCKPALVDPVAADLTKTAAAKLIVESVDYK